MCLQHPSKSRESYGMIYLMSKSTPSAIRYRSLLRLLSVAAAGSLALPGCVAGDGGGKKNPSQSPSSSENSVSTQPGKASAIQSRTFINNDGKAMQVDIVSLARLGTDKLKLQLRMSNVRQESDLFPDGFGHNLADIALIDGKKMQAYFPLTSTQDNVMESGYDDLTSVKPGAPIQPTVFFPAPPGASKVDIAMPATPLFNDIPIQGTAAVTKGEPDPNKVQLKPARIEDITNLTDDLNGDKSVDDSGSKESIRLNSDVLFALNKARLSNKAKSILADVARDIDKSKVGTINVDGYTDNSGNDSINNPLSRRRAEAVAAELKKLVTRSGVTYKTAGHGSSDPVATNGSAAGRQKNRRVTVTIGK